MTAKVRNTQSVIMTVERGLLIRAREAGINLGAALTAALDAELRKPTTRNFRATIAKRLTR